MGLILAVAGFVLVNGAMLRYFASIAKEKVPEDVRPLGAVLAAGGLLGVGGAVVAPSVASIAFGVMVAFFAGFLLWLIGQRRTPDGALIARVGALLPELAAPNQDGRMVRIAELRGRRVLLKFFRGFW